MQSKNIYFQRIWRSPPPPRLSENNSPSQFATALCYSDNTVFVLIDSSFHSAWCLVVNKKTLGSFLLVRVWFTLEIGTFKSQTRRPPSLVTVQITMQNCNVQCRVFMFALQSTLGGTIEALHLVCTLNQRSYNFAYFTSNKWSYEQSYYFTDTQSRRNIEPSCMFVSGRRAASQEGICIQLESVSSCQWVYCTMYSGLSDWGHQLTVHRSRDSDSSFREKTVTEQWRYK